MKITAQDLYALKIIDKIIEEPKGGAHRDRESIIARTGDAIAVALAEFEGMRPEAIRKMRHDKFLEIGRNL